jgi:capsular exopolysaccharide synthesis family protein
MPPTHEPEGHVPAAEQGDELDLRAYWRVVVRRRWTILSVFAAVVVLTLLFTLRQTKVYAATATLVIDLNAPRVLDKESVQDVVDTGTGGYWYSKEYYETQYKVITSRAVAQRVVEKLGLKANDRFLGIDGLDEAKREEARQKLDPADLLQDRLKVLPVKDSRVVRLEVDDRDPQLAALLANAVAEAYIADSLSVRTTTTQSASDWLEQQLADLEGKLDKSGKELFEFKKAHDIVATSWEDRQSMVSQRLTAINDALTRARIQRAQLESRNESIKALGDAVDRDDPALDALQPIAASMTIQQLKLRYLDTKVECAELEARYFEHHPKLDACNGKVATAKAALKRELQSTLDASKNEFDETVQTEGKLKRLLEETKADAFAVNQYERDYLELKRTYDNNQRLYEMVLKRLKDTGVSGMLQLSNIRILDRATVDEKPVSPKPLRNLALAVLLGLAGGVGLAFLLESLDTSITTREQIEERLGLPFLGIIPRIEEEAGAVRELKVVSAPTSAAAECLRSIRTNLLFMSPEKPLKTILVTSSGPGEGKTTTAASLAETMAGGGNRVLLVDADMRRPRVHKVFGLQPRTGLSSLILGEGTLAQAVVHTEVPNLDVLPCGAIPPNPAELLHAAGFAALLEEMARGYDRVVIDSPPAGVVSDAVVIGTQVDGTLLVFKGGQTSRDAAERTLKALQAVKARVFGAVLNDLDLEDRRYGQYYYYYRSGYYRDDEEGKPKGSAKVA